MNVLTQKAMDFSRTGVFALADVLVWLGESRNSVRNIVKRAIAADEIIHLRRGLYCLAERYNRFGISRNVLANLIYGPSYVSMESALAYHGWIPEAVHSVTSVALPRARSFATPISVFDYVQIRQSALLAGVERAASDSSSLSFLVARPLKALCDLIVDRGLDWTGIEPIVESLRIDEDSLESLTGKDFDELECVYRSRKAQWFLAGLRKELGK